MLEFFIVITVALIAYWWYKQKVWRDKLKWIPRVAGIPIIGNALELSSSTRILESLKKYTEKHGGVCLVNFGKQNRLVVSDYNLLKFLLSSTTILSKNRDYNFLKNWLGEGLLTAKAARWRKSRKIITPSFHFSILEQFVEVFESNGRIMLKLLEKEVDKDSVDVFPYVTLCALDIICETAMGVSVNAQTETYSDYVLAVKEMCRIAMDRSFSSIKTYDFLYPLSKDYYKERKYLHTLHSYTRSVIEKRKKELSNRIENANEKSNENVDQKKKKAFLDSLLQTTMDGQPLPDEYIREEVDTIMFEGHDSTASSISFALYCLANHPDIQTKAIEEQKEIFGNDRNRAATYRNLQEMKYLELVIKESMRLYPPVPFFGRKIDEDIEYKGGKILPKDLLVMIFVFGVNKNPKIFPDPEKFDPERFKDYDGSLPYAYIPFSAGPRNCIGQKFAMLETKSTVSKILRHFELLPASPKHSLILAAEIVLKSSNGIKIKLKRRNWDD